MKHLEESNKREQAESSGTAMVGTDTEFHRTDTEADDINDMKKQVSVRYDKM